MGKYIKKPNVIEAIIEATTFEEFIAYGKENCERLVNGMPWYFKYHGRNVTHETDERYIIDKKAGGFMTFTPDNVIVHTEDNISIWKKDDFLGKHDEVI
ncbi:MULTISPECIES: hypothetical protein [unclassified Arcicella]|uniref:hypothetical protein n=1 Tax=unclassified Arcicella TaxID=2644986 RepID=UPI002865C4FE|nr:MULTISPECIES: hypothetical protein [unclassified Arcicella]MDR6564923.1 hypothetical protein [Arcicella sp. BE51]MDR6814713.1 hypothetical protein [Arcicella sp. BE140]MDR6826159.1 hypothetical protein [Arcicella sp. BE139]